MRRILLGGLRASIGLIHEVKDAAEIVQDVRGKVVARIESLQEMRGEK